MMADTDIINFDYDPDKEPLSIVDTLKHMRQAMLDHLKNEEEKMKSSDWEYRRIHIASREIAEIMLSPDTPIKTRIQLEWATFAGYEWVRKDESNIFIDGKIV